MVKHTQTIRRLLPPNCLSVFDHLVGLALKGLIRTTKTLMRLCVFLFFEGWQPQNVVVMFLFSQKILTQ